MATAGSVFKIAPFPVLAASLVAVWEHHRLGIPLDGLIAKRGLKTSETLKREAAKAAKLCGVGGKCVFCAADCEKDLSPRVDWASFELCPCLSYLRSDTVWHREVADPAALLRILEEVDAHSRDRSTGIRDSLEVVSRTCGASKRKPDGTVGTCGDRFTLRTGAVASAVRTVLQKERLDAAKERRAPRDPLAVLSEFKWPTKCRECRDMARANHRPGPAAQDNAAPPTDRQLAEALQAAVLHQREAVAQAALRLQALLKGVA